MEVVLPIQKQIQVLIDKLQTYKWAVKIVIAMPPATSSHTIVVQADKVELRVQLLLWILK